jgi:hypothetical protein
MSQCFVAKVVFCYVSTIERQWDKYRVEIVAPNSWYGVPCLKSVSLLITIKREVFSFCILNGHYEISQDLSLLDRSSVPRSESESKNLKFNSFLTHFIFLTFLRFEALTSVYIMTVFFWVKMLCSDVINQKNTIDIKTLFVRVFFNGSAGPRVWCDAALE